MSSSNGGSPFLSINIIAISPAVGMLYLLACLLMFSLNTIVKSSHPFCLSTSAVFINAYAHGLTLLIILFSLLNIYLLFSLCQQHRAVCIVFSFYRPTCVMIDLIIYLKKCQSSAELLLIDFHQCK